VIEREKGKREEVRGKRGKVRGKRGKGIEKRESNAGRVAAHAVPLLRA